MDRQIVYPGQILPETTLLQMAKDSMIGSAKLAAAILGTSTIANGFAVVPTGPASLQVVVSPGEIYALTNIDSLAFSTLPADTTHSILKQGILLDGVTLSCPAPSTTGQSINYLVQATYQDQDSTPVLLPYYNSANPAAPYSGMGNNGLTQNTSRKGAAIVQVKAGASAVTGSQATPAPDSGYVGLYVVTVAFGQSTITSASISKYASAPLLPSGVLQSIQSGNTTFAVDTGSANAYTAAYSPAISTVTDGLSVRFRAVNANTGPSTFGPNGVTAQPIVSSMHGALVGGEIVAGSNVWLQWSSTLGSWVLLESTAGNFFGLGSTIGGRPITNANTLTSTELCSTPATWTGSPYSGTDVRNQGTLHHQSWTIGNGYATQEFTSISDNSKWYRGNNAGSWSAWVLIFTPNNLVGANTTVAGLIKTATQALVNAGVDTSTAVTPATLAGLASTTTLAGIIKLATQAMVTAGTDNNSVVTPLTLAGLGSTTSVAGIIKLATQAMVTAGTDNNSAVTPLTLATQFAALLVGSTTTTAGIIKLATQALVNAGSDNNSSVTPLTLATRLVAGYSLLAATNGYIVLPSWLGGLIIQWGETAHTGSDVQVKTLPIAFPTGVMKAVAGTLTNNNVGPCCIVKTMSTTTITTYASAGYNASWIIIGY